MRDSRLVAQADPQDNLADTIILIVQQKGKEPVRLTLPSHGEIVHIEHHSSNGGYKFAMRVSSMGISMASKERL